MNESTRAWLDGLGERLLAAAKCHWWLVVLGFMLGLLTGSAFGAGVPNDVALKETPATTVACYKGTTVFATKATTAECRASAAADAAARVPGTYSYGADQGRTKFEFKVTKPIVVAPPPAPVAQWFFMQPDQGWFVAPGKGTVRWNGRAIPVTNGQPVPCNGGSFGLSAAAVAGAKCEFLPDGVTPPVGNNPSSDMGQQPVPVIPPPPVVTPPATGILLRATSRQPTGSDIGAVRYPCGVSHTAKDDPIVFPGKPGASHSHTFTGNTTTNANSTQESLAAAKSSTCIGGLANLTTYWFPTLAWRDGTVLNPVDILNYYKGGYNLIPRSAITVPHAGQRFVAGNDPNNKGPVAWDTHTYVECLNGPAGHFDHIIDCNPGIMRVAGIAPNCTDGQNLDSPDHRAHMAYSGGGVCPPGFPIAIPEFQLNVDYLVQLGQKSSELRFSCDAGPAGGYCFHFDVWFNWNPALGDVAAGVICIRNLLDCNHGADGVDDKIWTGDGREFVWQ